MPRAHATSPGGTDSSSFEMLAVPTLSFATQTDYVYGYAWHTLNDLYSELVPYTEQQQESAVVHAVMAYGVANLDKPLTRAGVYLDDGLYASIAVGAPGKPIAEAQQFMVSLDFANAPLHTANFMRIVEGNAPAAGGGRGGPGAGGGRGGAQPEPPPIGKLLVVKNGVASGEIVSENQKKFAVKTLPKQLNPSVRHDGAGVFGMMSPNGFYLTLKANPGFDKKYTALGKVIAAADVVAQLKPGDVIRSIRLVRVGRAAQAFKADDETFKRLRDAAAGKRKTMP